MRPTAFITACLLPVVMISCTDNIEDHSACRRVQFRIEASADDTRTQWGSAGEAGYNIEWCADDRLRIVLSTADNMAEATIGQLSDDRLSASFDVDMELASMPDKYRLYACCPASAFEGITTAEDDPQQTPRLDFTVPSHQCSSAQSFDPAAAVIFGSSADNIAPASSVAMKFTSIVAYGKITIKDLPLDDGEQVRSITLAASRPLSGAATYSFDDSEPNTTAAQSASGCIEMEYAAAEGTFSAWFAAIPASLRDGWLCVCIKTDRGRYEKLIDLSGKEFTFEQNRILSFTVDMSTAVRSEHPVWHRISSPETICNGVHIIVCNGFYCSNSEQTLGHPQATPLSDAGITVDGDTLSGTVGDSAKWNLSVTDTGEVVISKYGDDDTWLYAANTNNGIYADNDVNRRYPWRFSTAGGAMRAVCNTRYLGIAAAGWRSYTSYTNANYISSAIELFRLYVE